MWFVLVLTKTTEAWQSHLMQNTEKYVKVAKYYFNHYYRLTNSRSKALPVHGTIKLNPNGWKG